MVTETMISLVIVVCVSQSPERSACIGDLATADHYGITALLGRIAYTTALNQFNARMLLYAIPVRSAVKPCHNRLRGRRVLVTELADRDVVRVARGVTIA